MKKMQTIPLERAGLAQSAVVSLATLCALLLLAAVLAYWLWVWLAPRPEPRAPAAALSARQSGAPAEAANGLFGNGQRERSGAAAGIAARLLGVVAATGSRPGYAVLRLDAKKTVAVLQGDEIEPGLRLAEVHADHIVLDRSGAREKLPLPEKNSK
jgi:general secretion pathway protein C